MNGNPVFGMSPVRLCLPPRFQTQLHVATSLSTGGGPLRCVLLSHEGFLVVYPTWLVVPVSGVPNS